MNQKHSIRRRIFFLFAGFTLFTCLCYSFLLLAYSWVVEDNVFNRILSEEARYIEAHHAATGQLPKPRHAFLSLYENWQTLPANIYKQHLKDPDQIEFSGANGGTIHLTPITLGANTYVLVADVTAFEVGGDYLPYVSASLVFFLIVFSLFAAAAAWPVARAATKPLLQLKHQVEVLDVKTFEGGLAATFPENEVGYLAHEIERSLLHIQAILKRETDFTRDVSHELRTPVTVLKNLATQLPESGTLTGRQVQQFKMSVQELELTIETLLALARDESHELTALVLRHELENCLVQHTSITESSPLQLDIRVPSTFRVTANPNLLRHMLNNLVRNALLHGDMSKLVIQAEDKYIVFSNPVGQENCSSKMPEIESHPTPKYRGMGLGLYLIKRIAEVFGWQVSTKEEGGIFYAAIDLEPKA